MPGGYRIITTTEWGLSSEDIHPEYLDTVARYDRHANGHYVVKGLRVTAIESDTEGKADIQYF